MSSLSRELVFLILQFLEEEKFKESAHKLEQETGFFFNMKYFEEKVLAGEWEEVEKYLSGFTKVDDNRYSMKIFFEIRKQKYLEALDRQDKAKAVDILVGDLKAFSTFNEDLYKEITQLLTLTNFRENEQLSKYGDTKTARSIMLIELKKLIEANPLFREKLVLPTLRSSRLRTLINQSLNWQHQLCKNPKSNPDIKTLFTDHTCNPQNGALAPGPATIQTAALGKPPIYSSLGTHSPFMPAATTGNANALAGWMANAAASSSIQAAVVTASSLPVPPNQVSLLKRPITPPTTLGMVDYQTGENEQIMKRLRPLQSVEEVTYPPRQHPGWTLDDLPRIVACSMHQGSVVTSMDFHPSHHTLLLVGSANGELALWEAGLREKLVSRAFKIWDMSTCSLQLQASMVKDTSVSVTRVTWSPDGNFLGAAFTKHVIHLYAYNGPNDFRQHLEVEAHVGQVNDLAFAHPNKQLCVVTCGDDKLIKVGEKIPIFFTCLDSSDIIIFSSKYLKQVWDLSGRKLFNFEGHEAPVYSVCPHQKENIQFIFSTAVDGKIKAWLYDNMGSRVDYDAPGRWCTTMLYSADGSRLFSCGTSKEGDSFLVEWNESEGAIKRTYTGFRKKSNGVVQFDTTQNHFLAVGEDNLIKFWDMENANVLCSTDADGGLQSLPRLRFNKEGNLLAVTTADNGIKILATAAGLRSLRVVEASSFEALRSPMDSNMIKVSGSSAVNINPVNCKVERSSPARPSSVLNGVDAMARSMERPRILDDATDKSKPWQLTEIVDPVQCRTVTMPESADAPRKVSRLLYTNSAVGLLVLGSSGVQKLWKWGRSEQNPSGKATANVVPQHWQPNSGLLMRNDVSGVNIDEAVPCIALSKNDSYVMSACGGRVSLFNMMTFKVMTTFMPPPPTSTFLAFHPQDNNIIAIGMEDSTIHIYNVRVDEVKSKLKGHQKRITGLAFSTLLNILVSSGSDAQLCIWSIDAWEKRKSVQLQLPGGKSPTGGDTGVQFHSDQIRLLVSHETQLAIYDASKMERIRQWIAQDVLPAPISYATYSCNSQLVYASFCDGNIGVFDADSLRLRCRVAPSVYLSPTVLNGNQGVYPIAVAAHPQDPNQFAIGLSDGSVKVLEPLEAEAKWGSAPPTDADNNSRNNNNNNNGNVRAGSSSNTSNNHHTPDQGQR
ncbi:topless-related protein 3-like isoform X1 [Impatiens glandulifera]|uniref:topless-related protein 3-like isoform X1 n=1 Tax=Impatiens glandulifera TaxID=253017 RepID=UPI001FB0933B|nr:topless-related protein 3-like isoform X1 [Impatiens glandulifera]